MLRQLYLSGHLVGAHSGELSCREPSLTSLRKCHVHVSLALSILHHLLLLSYLLLSLHLQQMLLLCNALLHHRVHCRL